MGTVIRIIDAASEYTGKIACWACVVLVLVLTYDTVARYVFNAPPMWAYETSYMIGGAIAVLGWSYVHRHHGHIRIDVFYSHLSRRGKAILDVICSLILLFPLLGVLLYTSTSWALFSWKMHEKFTETSWLPPAGPLKTVIALGLLLFALQCMAQFVRDLYFALRSKTL